MEVTSKMVLQRINSWAIKEFDWYKWEAFEACTLYGCVKQL